MTPPPTRRSAFIASRSPYTPDWKTKNLVLTPSLYVIGTTADQITTANVTSVKWYVGDSNTAITAGTNYALSGAKSHILTVKANVMAELPGIDYRCVITYKDESTGLSLTHPLTISFSRVVNGSGIVDLLVTTPNGNVFKNEEVASLTAKAELWRGSTVDTTKVSYKWAVMDASVTATSSTGYDADFGIGWRKLSDTADKYTGTATNGRAECDSHHVNEEVLEATYLTAMRRLVDSAEEVVEVVRDGTELALEPENKAAMERIDEETIQLQEAALALHKAKQRMEIGAVEYASRVKEYSERMKELEAERNELQGTAAKYAEVRMWLDTFIEQTMQSDTLTTVDGTTMKMLVDRIHVRNDGIVVEFKCGVAIEQEYVK